LLLLLLLLLQRAFVPPWLLRCVPAGTIAAIAAAVGLGAASGGTTIAGASNSLLPMLLLET
jgi:hypothetical protein